jgi:hypothetical protein
MRIILGCDREDREDMNTEPPALSLVFPHFPHRCALSTPMRIILGFNREDRENLDTEPPALSLVVAHYPHRCALFTPMRIDAHYPCL